LRMVQAIVPCKEALGLQCELLVQCWRVLL
jgi:hypothetical protein